MIYFIGCAAANAVKIGRTYNEPYKRLMSMQACCPLELQLIGVTEGYGVEEAALHARFAPSRIRGEWFTMTDELRDHVAQFPPPARRTRANWRQAA